MFEQDALMVYLLYHVCEVWRVKNGLWTLYSFCRILIFVKLEGLAWNLARLFIWILDHSSRNDVIWMLCKLFTNFNSHNGRDFRFRWQIHILVFYFFRPLILHLAVISYTARKPVIRATLWYIFGYELPAPFFKNNIKESNKWGYPHVCFEKAYEGENSLKFSVLSLYFQLVK